MQTFQLVESTTFEQVLFCPAFSQTIRDQLTEAGIDPENVWFVGDDYDAYADCDSATILIMDHDEFITVV